MNRGVTPVPNYKRKIRTKRYVSTNKKSKFRSNIESIESHLKSSEKHALDLSRQLGSLNEQLRDAEIREAECAALVSRAEKRVEDLSNEQLSTKRKLIPLYSSLVSCAKGTSQGGNSNLRKNARILSSTVLWRVCISNALLVSSDHATLRAFIHFYVEKLTTNRNKHSMQPPSPTKSQMQSNNNYCVDPFTPLCPYSLSGTCNDTNCPFQHLSPNLADGMTTSRQNVSRPNIGQLKKQQCCQYIKSMDFKRARLQAMDPNGFADDDPTCVVRLPTTRYFSQGQASLPEDWRTALLHALSGLPNTSSRSSGCGVSSTDPLVSAMQSLLRLPCGGKDRWARAALSALTLALEDPINRQSLSLWMVHVCLLRHVPPADRPDVGVIMTWLFHSFPCRWEVFTAVKALACSGPAATFAWTNDLLRRGVGGQTPAVDGTDGAAIVPFRAYLVMQYLEGMCVQGRHDDVVDVLCVLLSVPPIFASGDGTGTGTGTENVSVALPEVLQTMSPNVVPRTILWATLLVLLLTGECEGVRILCLANARLSYMATADWDSTVRRGSQLLRRSTVLRSRVSSLLDAVVLEMTPDDVVRGQRVTGSAADEAVCWAVVCVHTALRQVADSSSTVTARRCLATFRDNTLLFLFPPSVFCDAADGRPMGRELLDERTAAAIGCLKAIAESGDVLTENYYRHLCLDWDEEVMSADEREKYFWNVHKYMIADNVVYESLNWLTVAERSNSVASCDSDRLTALCLRIAALPTAVAIPALFICVLGAVSLRIRAYTENTEKAVRLGSSVATASVLTSELLTLTFVCVEASLATVPTPDTRVLHVDNDVALLLSLDSATALGALPQHELLLRVLRRLDRDGLLDWDDVGSVLRQASCVLPSVEAVVCFFLDWRPAHLHRESLLAAAFSECIPTHLYEHMTPRTCWRLQQLMCRAERFDVVVDLRSALGECSHPQASFFALCVDEDLGLDGKVAADLNVDDAEAAEMCFRGVCLEEISDLSSLDDSALLKLHQACNSPATEPAANTAVVADLSGCFPAGEKAVPLSLSLATSLTEVSLEHNNFRSLPSQVLSLSRLQRLNLSWNVLSFLPRTLHTSLPSLRILNLSHNKFTVFPTTLVRMTSLCELHLSHNSLEYLPNQIVNLTELKVLDVADNALKVLPSGLSQKLQFLKLSGNPAASIQR